MLNLEVSLKNHAENAFLAKVDIFCPIHFSVVGVRLKVSSVLVLLAF